VLFRKQTEDSGVYIYNAKFKSTGLTTEEAIKSIERYGENQIADKKRKTPITIFLNQFNDFMIWVLFGAAAISAVMGEKADAVTIAAIILVNGVLGFIQEYRTEKSMEALKELTAPTARVMRDGKIVIIPAKYLVPDDLIILESGDRVPADSILIESTSLQVDESLLTGESVPVDKKTAEQRTGRALVGTAENTVYMGTVITNGRGKAIVTATGMMTEMGKIAGLLQSVEETQTPLQERLERMGKIMVYACLAACLIVTVTGILKGENIYTMFLTGVSLAVAAIPEGLPAIVTVSLAVGVQRMLKRNALVRRLPAVETLGCTNIICSDKTGTLTENKMTVKNIYCGGSIFDVSGNGYDIRGEFIKGGKKINSDNFEVLKLLLEASVSCNNSTLEIQKSSSRLIPFRSPKEDSIATSGDPTEISLMVCGYKAKITREYIEEKYKRVNEIPFDSNRKRMSVITKHGSEYIVFLKGAIDNTLELCNYIQLSTGSKKLTPELKNEILSYNDLMTRKALRVLAIAYRKLSGVPHQVNVDSIEKDLVFLGLVGMIDPPRKEAVSAIEICKKAGIKPVMITGDHKGTAVAIAKELKLMDRNDRVLTGSEIDQIDDKSFNSMVKNVSVYARVTPKHKLRIVKAYKNNGYIVAMTGDGVNDAPAVKEADIGISMGIMGTDVTKEASSMILLDDNFATIVAAVEEGRIIYDNIRKFIRYLLSCNLGEVLTMFIASLIGYATPLLPIQILWVNLVTDGLPAIALGVDPPDHGIMLRPPRSKKENIFSQGLARKILLRGTLIGLCTLAIFVITLKLTSGNIVKARTMAFATLVMSQLIHVFECRSERHSIFEINFFANKYLIAAVVVSTSMLCAAVYIPFLQPVFKTVSLSLGDWIEILFFSGAISLIVNLRSYIKSGT